MNLERTFFLIICDANGEPTKKEKLSLSADTKIRSRERSDFFFFARWLFWEVADGENCKRRCSIWDCWSEQTNLQALWTGRNWNSVRRSQVNKEKENFGNACWSEKNRDDEGTSASGSRWNQTRLEASIRRLRPWNLVLNMWWLERRRANVSQGVNSRGITQKTTKNRRKIFTQNFVTLNVLILH